MTGKETEAPAYLDTKFQIHEKYKDKNKIHEKIIITISQKFLERFGKKNWKIHKNKGKMQKKDSLLFNAHNDYVH